MFVFNYGTNLQPLFSLRTISNVKIMLKKIEAISDLYLKTSNKKNKIK